MTADGVQLANSHGSRWQFSLRSIMVAITVVCVLLTILKLWQAFAVIILSIVAAIVGCSAIYAPLFAGINAVLWLDDVVRGRKGLKYVGMAVVLFLGSLIWMLVATLIVLFIQFGLIRS